MTNIDNWINRIGIVLTIASIVFFTIYFLLEIIMYLVKVIT